MTEASIYLDNAATSWPKPEPVGQAVAEYWKSGGTVGRSASPSAETYEQQLSELRQQLRMLLGAAADKEICFTGNTTESLNLAIHGMLLHRLRTGNSLSKHGVSKKLRVAVSQAEHNSILRPLHYWQNTGHLDLLTLPCQADASLNPDVVREAFAQKPVDLLCLTHASNVTGAINPIQQIGQICREAKCLFLLDAAQTVGYLPVRVVDWNVDILATAGHKGLAGPLGTGVLYIRKELQEQIDSCKMGGTGTESYDPHPVNEGPAKWEAGNPNLPGLLGLAAAVPVVARRLDQRPLDSLNRAAEWLWHALQSINEIQLLADPGYNPFTQEFPDRLPIISLTSALLDPATMAIALQNSGIVSRAGYHCAPWVHQCLGQPEGGSLRLSPGYDSCSDNQLQEVVDVLIRIHQFS